LWCVPSSVGIIRTTAVTQSFQSTKKLTGRNGKSKLPLFQHLADAISHGPSVYLNCLGITQENIEELEQILRRKTLKSNVSKLSAIKLVVEKVKPIEWDKLRLMVAFLKRKYGLLAVLVTYSTNSNDHQQHKSFKKKKTKSQRVKWKQ